MQLNTFPITFVFLGVNAKLDESHTKSLKSPARSNFMPRSDSLLVSYINSQWDSNGFRAVAWNLISQLAQWPYLQTVWSQALEELIFAGDLGDFVGLGKVFNSMYALVWWPCEGCIVVFEGLFSGHSGGRRGAVSSLYIFPTGSVISSGARWNCDSSKEINTGTRYVSLSFIIPVNFEFRDRLKSPIHFLINLALLHMTPRSLGRLCRLFTNVYSLRKQTDFPPVALCRRKVSATQRNRRNTAWRLEKYYVIKPLHCRTKWCNIV